MIRFYTDTHSSRNSLTCLRRARVTPASRCASLGHRPDLQALLAFLCNDPTMYRFCCYAPYAGDLLIWKCRTGQLSLRELTFSFWQIRTSLFVLFFFCFLFFYEQGVLSARADNEAFLLCFCFLFCFVFAAQSGNLVLGMDSVRSNNYERTEQVLLRTSVLV